ncbi:MAG: hypothetical protein A2046_08710 [Bacteroidetes bacterium GWA2_30_7]|nr:MAG: hypothetical protein A2046_08710 [Bacteroidetes bacterium GWA2_30_7]
MTLKQILYDLYPEEDAKKAEGFLMSYKFHEHLDLCLKIIRQKLLNEESEINQHGVIQLSAVASSLLSGVNEKIRLLELNENDQFILQILSDISSKIFEYILKSSKSNKSVLINQISIALHDTCLIFNYNEDKLFEFFKFRQMQHYANILLNNDKINNPINPKDLRFYHWKGNKTNKQNFIALFYENQLITKSSKKSIYKLFEPSFEFLEIELMPENIRITMTLFYWLKKKKLLIPSGYGGFYKPLKQHIIGFSQNIIENKSVGYYSDKLKKNHSEWLNNTNKVEKWLKDLK